MYFWKLNSTKSSRNQKIFHKNTWNEDAPPTAILFLELLFLIGIITRIIIIYRTPAVSGSGRNPGRNNSRKNVHSCRKILRPLKSSREQRQPHRRFKGIRLGQTYIYAPTWKTSTGNRESYYGFHTMHCCGSVPYLFLERFRINSTFHINLRLDILLD